MKITVSFLYLALAALAAGMAPAHADTPAQSESAPAASPDAEVGSASSSSSDSADSSDSAYAALQERYRLMHEHMLKIRQTQDPVERRRLMHEHWQTFHGGMGGGHGMGRGMMVGGGQGVAPGMMGGYGMGLRMPSLSAEQQETIATIREETRKKNWHLMGMLMEQQAKLADMNNALKLDALTVKDAYSTIAELQRQMQAAVLDAHKRMAAVLTPEQVEQLEQLRQYWRRGRYPGN